MSWYMSLSMTSSLKLKSRNTPHCLPNHPHRQPADITTARDTPGSTHIERPLDDPGGYHVTRPAGTRWAWGCGSLRAVDSVTLHVAARRYLMERYDELVDQYAALPDTVVCVVDRTTDRGLRDLAESR